ncbi:hypothetical protein MKK69_02545 [Methylobacterium sp. J-026]|uniref:hypothetical protein n=1 Tax=Methylobacterium sp. J-026 TaxID=2836624 RepID=UPI001FB9DE42|nr:hypothetical protein [Methylobacterium sp. J-026]MCJ2132955.1 hypothetical protein [Methylobacterium sp. J-026]
MKRRSARPFMVEVKHARTQRTAPTDADPQTRPAKVLWQELVQAETKPVRPPFEAAPAPRPEPKEPEAPARRVLPSLVPMFENTAEPQIEVEPTPRPRRPRREQAPALAQPAREIPAAQPVPEARPAAIRLDPIAALPGLTDPAGPAQELMPRPAPWRRTKELRLGERWKRRLPPYAR